MSKRLVHFIVVFIIITAMISCANRGTPQGGPKDESPPTIIKSSPENYTTNFNEEEIKIYFDEYVKLKDITKQLIISPPMKTQPEITPLGSASKYITIKIYDTLQPNTTYAINFGASIVDNNEENPYPYYRYVFSTGTYIDSLEVIGTIKDALSQETDDFVSVMLYEADTTYTDSIIYKEQPKYITNTLDSTTTFTLSNLRAGKYKLVALKDNNKDNKYQQKSDKIGFKKEFITIPSDTTYTIKLFEEVPDFKVVRPQLLSGEKIAFGFEGDYDGATVEIRSVIPDTFAYKLTKAKETDSLLYWYKPRMNQDSLLFNVKHPSGYEEDFTVRISEQKRDSLIINTSHSNTLHFHETFGISGSVPFEKFDLSKVNFIDKDSTDVAYKTAFDTLNNTLNFEFDKIEDQNYNITILPGAFTDFFENQNDTLSYKLRTKTFADYGNVRVNLKNASYPVIVQLVDNKGEVKREQISTKQEPIDFKNVVPAELYIRVIFDENGNGIYDSGNFLKGIQPERVSYDSTPMDIRAGWDEVREFILLD